MQHCCNVIDAYLCCDFTCSADSNSLVMEMCWKEYDEGDEGEVVVGCDASMQGKKEGGGKGKMEGKKQVNREKSNNFSFAGCSHKEYMYESQ